MDLWQRNSNVVQGREQRSEKYAIYNASGILMRDGKKTNLFEFESVLTFLARETSDIETVVFLNPWFKTQVKFLKVDCLRNFCGLMTEILVQRGMNIGAAKHFKLIFPASVNISGIAPPKLLNKMSGDAILVDETNYRQIQRSVATSSFYGSI